MIHSQYLTASRQLTNVNLFINPSALKATSPPTGYNIYYKHKDMGHNCWFRSSQCKKKIQILSTLVPYNMISQTGKVDTILLSSGVSFLFTLHISPKCHLWKEVYSAWLLTQIGSLNAQCPIYFLNGIYYNLYNHGRVWVFLYW